jgi:DNA-binding transcriptional regulator YdaS (Cro superfamily)
MSDESAREAEAANSLAQSAVPKTETPAPTEEKPQKSGAATQGEGTGSSRSSQPDSKPTPTPSKVEPPKKPTGTGDGGAPSVARQVGLGAAGVWLIVLVLTSVIVAVIIFSATQFQSRVAGLTISGGTLTIWKADQLRARWAASRDAWSNSKKALYESEQALSQLTRLRSPLADDATRAGLDIYRVRSQLADKISRANLDVAVKVREARIEDVSAIIYPVLDALLAKDATIGADLESFVKARNTMREHETVEKALEARVTEATDNLKRSAAAVEAFETKITSVVEKFDGIPDEQRRAIENTIFEFQTMYEYTLYWPVYLFALAPTDLLVLILVTVMGVLGSTLQLTHVYTAEFAARPISFYIFRPFLGVITAFVIFIVAKAGVPLIADPGRLGGSSPVNPYFISFLAIISGLLSERALEALRRVGSSYFRGEGSEPARWARIDIREAFKKLNRDPAKLRKLIGTRESEFNEWLDGKEPIPPSAQIYISAALDIPRRELFTDIAPDADKKMEKVEQPTPDPNKPTEPIPDGQTAEQKTAAAKGPVEQERAEGSGERDQGTKPK